MDSVTVVVKVTPECPDGLEAALILYSESEDESYILKTICEKYGLLPGPEGKVNVKYYPKGSKKSAIERCSIRMDDDGEADLVFAKKPTKEGPKEGEAVSAKPSGKYR